MEKEKPTNPSEKREQKEVITRDDQRNFYRLLQLFPNYHPVGLERIFKSCKRHFVRTIDNILYVNRYKSFLNARKNRRQIKEIKKITNNLAAEEHQEEEASVQLNVSPSRDQPEVTDKGSQFGADDLQDNFNIMDSMEGEFGCSDDESPSFAPHRFTASTPISFGIPKPLCEIGYVPNGNAEGVQEQINAYAQNLREKNMSLFSAELINNYNNGSTSANDVTKIFKFESDDRFDEFCESILQDKENLLRKNPF